MKVAASPNMARMSGEAKLNARSPSSFRKASIWLSMTARIWRCSSGPSDCACATPVASSGTRATSGPDTRIAISAAIAALSTNRLSRRPVAARSASGGTMIVTTTPGVDGRRVVEYQGIVTGEAILGANVFRDFFASVRDIVGGRSGGYEKVLRAAREQALEEMAGEARSRGADAVVGVDIDYEVIGKEGSMLMVSASGTAVRLG
jgi:uncharacterized protein YbjQ (UPF0145 family)